MIMVAIIMWNEENISEMIMVMKNEESNEK